MVKAAAYHDAIGCDPAGINVPHSPSEAPHTHFLQTNVFHSTLSPTDNGKHSAGMVKPDSPSGEPYTRCCQTQVSCSTPIPAANVSYSAWMSEPHSLSMAPHTHCCQKKVSRSTPIPANNSYHSSGMNEPRSPSAARTTHCCQTEVSQRTLKPATIGHHSSGMSEPRSPSEAQHTHFLLTKVSHSTLTPEADGYYSSEMGEPRSHPAAPHTHCLQTEVSHSTADPSIHFWHSVSQGAMLTSPGEELQHHKSAMLDPLYAHIDRAIDCLTPSPEGIEAGPLDMCGSPVASPPDWDAWLTEKLQAFGEAEQGNEYDEAEHTPIHTTGKRKQSARKDAAGVDETHCPPDEPDTDSLQTKVSHDILAPVAKGCQLTEISVSHSPSAALHAHILTHAANGCRTAGMSELHSSPSEPHTHCSQTKVSHSTLTPAANWYHSSGVGEPRSPPAAPHTYFFQTTVSHSTAPSPVYSWDSLHNAVPQGAMLTPLGEALHPHESPVLDPLYSCIDEAIDCLMPSPGGKEAGSLGKCGPPVTSPPDWDAWLTEKLQAYGEAEQTLIHTTGKGEQSARMDDQNESNEKEKVKAMVEKLEDGKNNEERKVTYMKEKVDYQKENKELGMILEFLDRDSKVKDKNVEEVMDNRRTHGGLAAAATAVEEEDKENVDPCLTEAKGQERTSRRQGLGLVLPYPSLHSRHPSSTLPAAAAEAGRLSPIMTEERQQLKPRSCRRQYYDDNIHKDDDYLCSIELLSQDTELTDDRGHGDPPNATQNEATARSFAIIIITAGNSNSDPALQNDSSHKTVAMAHASGGKKDGAQSGEGDKRRQRYAEMKDGEEVENCLSEKPHACPECGKSFSRRDLMDIHRRKHTGEKPYPCPECGKIYSHCGHMHKHRHKPTGEKSYPCPECGQRFSQRGHMHTHRRIHTGEKPYQCPECGERFNTSSQVFRHRRTHTGKKPYSCPDCGQRFSESYNMRAHRRKHTSEKPYQCPECGRRFSRSNHMHSHRYTHQREALPMSRVWEKI